MYHVSIMGKGNYVGETIALLEHTYDEGRNAMSRPILTDEGSALPDRFLMSFMGDALERFVAEMNCIQISNHHSEVRDFPIYAHELGGVQLGLVQAPVGAPAAAIMADLLIASGVRAIVACGGCGVIRPIESGRVLVPTQALRDEGTSFHYIAPSREVEIDSDGVEKTIAVLDALGLRHDTCKVWTCDGFFRETPTIVRKRAEQGYAAVDMECAALAAVAQAYDAQFVQILYSGDTLADPENHDERGWITNHSARDVTLRAALHVLSAL